MKIVDPELCSVGETSATVCFATADDTGEPTPLPADVIVGPASGGARRVVRAEAEDAATTGGVHMVTVDGLEPGVHYDIDICGDDDAAEPDQLFFPNEFRTLRRPPGELLASFATVSDMHFGEEVCGLGPSPDIGPVFRAADEDPPYWQYANDAILADVDAARVDCIVVKGDLTGEGLASEFAVARSALDALTTPWHAVLGNHDAMQRDVDGLALLGQPKAAARAVEVEGCRLVLLDTVDPGRDGGMLPKERLRALEAELESCDGVPALLFAHHYTSAPQKLRKRAFGIHRGHSKDLLDLLSRHPNVGGFFAGHTHRNRSRTFPETGRMPHVEVCATKDYPGGWALYRVYEGGYTQELRRCAAPKALRWAYRTKDMYFGLYRTYALGTLRDRCFTYSWPTRER